ncbi:MAG: DUF4911 domain-containing protein [Desulfobulbus sp.]|jgi:hypothetical protein|uniref:DUF4911 domain-containing protein n=1 Tax=Desulfobulbus sp. TaxID=895 RepID=UPI00283E9196|nr:DUF4911 domain-containing protein [Desulfobulbus sp.]MDR2549270.1 DUF4911 domain-containing protein [Desulfobulbus sp.]
MSHTSQPVVAMPMIVEWFLLIRPEKISWLRFILEGYDGLAILSTLAVERGLVRIQTLDCNMVPTMRLLNELAEKLSPFPSQSTDDRALMA